MSECLKDFYKPTNLDSFYNQPSPNQSPALVLCNDRYYKQKHSHSNYFLNTNSNNKPLYIKNQTNTGDLQRGYSENIDIDSELKWINHIDDQCFFDNYKMDFKTNKSLSKHYEKIFKPQEEKINEMKQRKINEKELRDKNCLDFKTKNSSFQTCNVKTNLTSPYPSDNKSKLVLNSQPVHYQFHNDKYIDYYPCEALFNNFTQRSCIPNIINRINY